MVPHLILQNYSDKIYSLDMLMEQMQILIYIALY